MARKEAIDARARRSEAVCHWCKEPFANPDDRRIHVSKLGAPAPFHPTCFEEYELTTPA